MLTKKLSLTLRHSSWTFLIVLVSITCMLILVGCSSSSVVEPPSYPDIAQVLNVPPTDMAPNFGDQILKASGSYYLVGGSIETVVRWFDLQVAEYKLVYVAERQAHGVVHHLYRIADASGPFTEIVMKAQDDDHTFIAIYTSITATQSPVNDNRIQRFWRMLIGQYGPSLADKIFDWIVGHLGFTLPFYENIILKPILNSLYVFRWLFTWPYGFVLIFFALFVVGVIDRAKNLLQWPLKKFALRTPGRTSPGCTPLLLFFGTALLVFLVFDVLASTAIWQVLNGSYDISPSGQAWVHSRLYPILSQDIHFLASIPPGNSLLSWRLDKPNYIIVPIVIFFTKAFVHVAKEGNLETNFEVLKAMDPDRANWIAELTGLSGNSKNIWDFEKQREDEEYERQKHEAYANRYAVEAAILAFVPLGVSVFFVVRSIIETLNVILETLDSMKLQKAYETRVPFRPVAPMFKWSIRVGLTLLVLGWLVLVDKGTVFERAYRLFDQSTPIVTPSLGYTPIHNATFTPTNISHPVGTPAPTHATVPTGMSSLAHIPTLTETLTPTSTATPIARGLFMSVIGSPIRRGSTTASHGVDFDRIRPKGSTQYLVPLEMTLLSVGRPTLFLLSSLCRPTTHSADRGDDEGFCPWQLT